MCHKATYIDPNPVAEPAAGLVAVSTFNLIESSGFCRLDNGLDRSTEITASYLVHKWKSSSLRHLADIETTISYCVEYFPQAI